MASLEVLAHAETLEMLYQYVALEVSLPEDSMTVLKDLSEDWQQEPPPDSTLQLGQEWFSKGETLLLKVPSVLIPDEHNYLINPSREAFRDVTVAKPIPLTFDARVLSVTTD